MSVALPRITPLRAALIAGGVAAAWRAALCTRYYGQEEGDYGNLGLIFGTLESGFRYVETEHMPLYTALSALICAITGDAQLAGQIVAVTMGTATAGLTAWAAGRWCSPTAGLVAGLLVAAQPDLALLSASTLRSSTYTAAVLATVVAAGTGRPILAALAFGAAFLTRFDALLTLLPLVVLTAIWPTREGSPTSWLRRGASVVLACGVVLAWAAFYRGHEGTWRFWDAVASRNTADYDHLALLPRLWKGAQTLRPVLLDVVPDHISWVAVGCALLGLAAIWNGQAARVRPARLFALAGVFSAAFFCAVVLLSAYRWDHNLYWQWLCNPLPLVLGLAAHGAVLLVGVVRRPRGAAAFALGLCVATALPMYRQTAQQLIRSDVWMGTQVRFAQWVEAAHPEEVTVLADLVPATWFSRRAGGPTVLRWSQQRDAIPANDPTAFGVWLLAERVSVVIWFREEWVGAAEIAPFLAQPRSIVAGPVSLEPLAAEQEYGFVAWAVRAPGLSRERFAVPADAGAVSDGPPAPP